MEVHMNTSQFKTSHHCNVLEQKELISRMTRCDNTTTDGQERYECYLKETTESRESNACMFS